MWRDGAVECYNIGISGKGCKNRPIKSGHGKETDYGSGKHISRSVDLQVVRLEFVSLPFSSVLRMSHGGDGDAESCVR